MCAGYACYYIQNVLANCIIVLRMLQLTLLPSQKLYERTSGLHLSLGALKVDVSSILTYAIVCFASFHR